MAVQYRQLQAPTLIDTNVPDSGGAQAAESLANAFKHFETGIGNFNTQLQTKRGEEAGQAAGSEAQFGKRDASGKLIPDEKGKSVKDFNRGLTQFSAYAKAYNNAALRSYVIRSQTDAETTAARLQVENSEDPEAFVTKLSAARDAVVKAAPSEARAALNEMYTQRISSGAAQVTQAAMVAARNTSRTDVSEGIARSTDRIAQLLASNDPAKHAEADEEQVKLDLMIAGARNDGTLTAIETEAVRKQSHAAITQQTVTARFRNELQNPYGDPIGFIQRLKEANKTSNALLPAEEEKLVNSLLSDLQESNSLASAAASQEAAETKARFAVGDRQATADLLSGQLTQRRLLSMVQKQELSPEVARTLLNELQTGDSGVDDSRVAFDVRTNLLRYTEEEIASMPGLKWSTRGDLLIKRREESQGWKGTQAAREGENRIDRALGIVPGTMIQTLSDEVKTQRNQALTEWYNEVDKLPAAERQGAAISTSEDVIGRYIRKAKSAQAQDLSEARARYISRAGDPGQMGTEERKKYEARLAKYDSDIATAQAEAARK